MIDRRRTLALLLLSLDAQRALASVASGRNTERRSGVRSSDRPGKEPDRASKATKENRHREYVAAG